MNKLLINCTFRPVLECFIFSVILLSIAIPVLAEEVQPEKMLEPQAETQAVQPEVQDIKDESPMDEQLPSLGFRDQAEPPSIVKEGLKTVGMLVVLLSVFWWFSNWLKKSGRLARLAGNGSGIELVEVFSVGQKEKIVLIRVKEQEFLVGVTQHTIQSLHHFDTNTPGHARNKDAPGATEFSKILGNAESQS